MSNVSHQIFLGCSFGRFTVFLAPEQSVVMFRFGYPRVENLRAYKPATRSYLLLLKQKVRGFQNDNLGTLSWRLPRLHSAAGSSINSKVEPGVPIAVRPQSR